MESVSRSNASWKTIDLVYCGLFATLMMIGANITSFAPFLTVGVYRLRCKPFSRCLRA